MVFIGCAGTNIKPSVCDNIPEGSYSVICDISNHLKMQPEYVSAILKVGNLAGLASNVYTAQQASAFVDDIRRYLTNAELGNGLLYATLLEYGKRKYQTLPATVQAAIIILEDFTTIDLSIIPGSERMLSAYDFGMLHKHLDKQDVIILPFTIVK